MDSVSLLCNSIAALLKIYWKQIMGLSISINKNIFMKYILSLGYCFVFFSITFQSYGQTEKLKPHLNHTAIFVKDLKASKSFYENIIEMRFGLFCLAIGLKSDRKEKKTITEW